MNPSLVPTRWNMPDGHDRLSKGPRWTRDMAEMSSAYFRRCILTVDEVFWNPPTISRCSMMNFWVSWRWGRVEAREECIVQMMTLTKASAEKIETTSRCERGHSRRPSRTVKFSIFGCGRLFFFRYVTLCWVMLCYIIPCHAFLCHAILVCVMRYFVVFCYDKPCC